MLFNDCERLVIAFFPSISSSALQLYHSVLSFVPKETALTKAYAGKQHAVTLVKVIHGVADSWNACLGTVIAHEGKGVCAVDFSPDGRTAVSGGDSKIRLWDTLTCTLLLVLSGHTSIVSSVKYSPDGTRIVSASGDDTIKIWDAVSGVVVCTLPIRNVYRAMFTPDGRWIVSRSHFGCAIKIWSAQGGACLATLTDHQSHIASIAVSPDGQWMVSSSDDGELHIRSLNDIYIHRVLAAQRKTAYSVAFTPDSTQILTAPLGVSTHEPMSLWDVRTGKRLRELTLSGFPGKSIHYLAFDPAGDEVVCGLANGTVLILNVYSGQVQHTFAGHTQFITGLAYNRDGTRIVSCSDDGTMRVWDATKYAMGATTAKGTGWASGLSDSAGSPSCRSAAFSHDGSRLVCAYSNGALEVERTGMWDQEWMPLSRENSATDYAAFSPDGSVILAVDTRKREEMTLWDAATGSLRAHLPVGHDTPLDDTMWSGVLGYKPLCFGGYSSLAMFSHNSQYLITRSDNGVCLWSVATGQLVRQFSGHQDRVQCIAFSLDATRIATGSKDKSIIVWDVNTGASLVTMTPTERYAGSVYCVAFSAAGKRVASGSYDARVRVWDAKTGELLHSLAGHPNWVRSVAFAPRGDVVISSSSSSGTLRFWDVETGDCLHVFDEKTWGRTIEVAPDGTGIVVDGGRVVQLWSPPEADTPVTTAIPWLPRRTWPIYYIEEGWVFSLSSAGRRTRLCWVPGDWQVKTSLSHTVVFGHYRRTVNFTALHNYIDALHGTIR